MKTTLLTACLALSWQPLDAQEAREIDSREARRIIKEFSAAMKSKQSTLSSRLAAVNTLGRSRNSLLVKPLLKTARSDSIFMASSRGTKALWTGSSFSITPFTSSSTSSSSSGVKALL